MTSVIDLDLLTKCYDEAAIDNVITNVFKISETDYVQRKAVLHLFMDIKRALGFGELSDKEKYVLAKHQVISKNNERKKHS